MSQSDANLVRIFDTTLRDGEQSPGASMTLDEKIRIAETLEAMQVDVIEAGFAIASNGDFECVKTIANHIRNSSICSLARAALGDIDRAAEALKGAADGRIHTFIATSPLHMKVKLQMQPDEVIEAIHKSVSHARSYVPNVEWSAEDATRTELDFLCKAVETAIRAGATTINLPDTVGYATPDEYGHMFRTVIETVPDADKAIFSTHCHNDLGLAVANSLAGVAAGAPANRMYDQRYWRARRQRCDGRGGDGNPHTRGCAAVQNQYPVDRDYARQQDGVHSHGLCRAKQQGHRRGECFCPRIRYSSGRCVEKRRNLRNYDP